MLICLGGFLGSGRKVLARRLARLHHLHVYDLEAKKNHYHVFEEGGTVKEVAHRVRSDEQRMLLYQHALEDLRLVAKMHPDTIVEDAFNRAKPRAFFLAEAAKYFDKVVFVWIDSDESHVASRLSYMEAEGLIPSVARGEKRRQKAAVHFDGLSPDERVFKCVRGDLTELNALWSLIEGESGPVSR